MKIFRWLDGFSLIILGVVALCSFPFLGVGLYEAYKAQHKLNSFVHTQGIVVDNFYSTTNDNGTVSGAYQPVVEFKLADGKSVRFTDGVGSLPPDYEVGSQVDVVYNPQNPKEANINSLKRVWLAPTIFIVVGLLPVIIAAVVMWKINNPKR